MISTVMSATIGQLLRSGQRDDQYLSQLNTEFNQIIQNCFGVRNWIQIKDILPEVSNWIYYSLTTLSGLQTLGEEYVNIVQTDGHKVKVPTLAKRVIAITLQTMSPYLLSRLLSSIRHRLQNRQHFLPSIVTNDYRRELILSLLPIIEELFKYFHRIHLILFYLNGNYYYLSKRVANISYISMNSLVSDQTDNRSRNLYKILGYLTLSQLCISLLVRFYSLKNSGIKRSDDLLETNKSETVMTAEDVEVGHRCSLCLEKRRQTTATTCGHLFCWLCIAEWLQRKSECPLCREPIQSSRLVLLNNYP